MLFRRSERPKMIAQDPFVSFGALSKALGAAWAQLSDAENNMFKQQQAEIAILVLLQHVCWIASSSDVVDL